MCYLVGDFISWFDLVDLENLLMNPNQNLEAEKYMLLVLTI